MRLNSSSIRKEGRLNIIHRHAPAKINLLLHVTGREKNGYHLLQSLIVFADYGDRLRFHRHKEGFRLDVAGPFAAAITHDDRNLVFKAAKMLAEETGVACNARIELEKNLPVAAGLGGGSADAAAALLGLSELWNTKHDLSSLAQRLGTDVAACLAGKALWAEGTGDRITPLLSAEPVHMVLINPGMPCPTADVYKGFEGPFSASQEIAAVTPELIRNSRNDLTQSARRVCPAIADVLDAMERSSFFSLTRLSGSGATCFGLCPTRAKADKAAADLALKHRGWWVKAVTAS